jgi:hypothetical protein
VLTAAIVIAGWIVGYLVLRWVLQRSISRVRAEFEKEIEVLRDTPSQTETSGNEFSKIGPIQNLDDLTPETVSALGQSLSAVVGKEVRISSVKKVPVSHAMSNPWAREGCVLVQNSHQLERKVRFDTKPKAVRPFRNEVVRRAA